MPNFEHEFENGSKVKIRYGPAKVIAIDAKIEDADWPKRTWDLPFDPDDDEALDAYLANIGKTRAEWRKLPASRGKKHE